LIRTITSVRENKARVEGPEQTEQFAQLAAVHEGWWRSSVAQTEDAVGCLVVFVEGLEEGNFHVQARSKLLVRAPEVVNPKALAEMNHIETKPAPIGPPSLTAEAWLTSRDAVQDAPQDPEEADVTVVAVRRQTGVELNQRSFSTRQISLSSAGVAVHVEDADRDRARGNRSFARSTAGLTPGIFAEEMSRRSCNITTAVIEEVEVVEEIGTAHSTAAQKEIVPRALPQLRARRATGRQWWSEQRSRCPRSTSLRSSLASERMDGSITVFQPCLLGNDLPIGGAVFQFTFCGAVR
jgi:hypothetical protein